MSDLALSKESTGSWNANAAYWDEGMGRDGNKYWNVLQVPTLERLIDVKPDSKALDLASGTGLTSRWLARRGATVIATDGSPQMLEHAATYNTPEEAARIYSQVLDVTQPAAFEALLADPRAVRR